jgi:hypothetical protein
LALAWLVAAGPLAAQEEPPAREAVLRQVVERFFENVRGQAGLTDEQAGRFGRMWSALERRRGLEQREREVWRALSQMRPGVAADPDSATRLLDALLALRTEQVEGLKADFMIRGVTHRSSGPRSMAWERLQRNIEELIRRRMQHADAPGAPRRPEACPPAAARVQLSLVRRPGHRFGGDRGVLRRGGEAGDGELPGRATARVVRWRPGVARCHQHMTSAVTWTNWNNGAPATSPSSMSTLERAPSSGVAAVSRG